MTKEELEKQTMEWKNNYILKLEKEKLGLKDYCDKYTKTILSLRHNVVDLEKENAELKHTIAELRRDKDNLNTHTKAQEKLSEYRSEQLTKAKDLLLRFIELKNKPCASGHSINMLLYENICAETEQFLNSEVEK